jgi:WD40 repeat protein
LDAKTGKLINTFAGHTNLVNSVAFNRNSETLASASDDKTIKLWNLSDAKLIRTLEGHSGVVNSVAFSSDGQAIASGSDKGDYTARIWRN